MAQRRVEGRVCESQIPNNPSRCSHSHGHSHCNRQPRTCFPGASAAQVSRPRLCISLPSANGATQYWTGWSLAAGAFAVGLCADSIPKWATSRLDEHRGGTSEYSMQARLHHPAGQVRRYDLHSNERCHRSRCTLCPIAPSPRAFLASYTYSTNTIRLPPAVSLCTIFIPSQ